MILDFGQGEKELNVSMFTLVVYEQEFHRDLIKDVFGVVEINNTKTDKIALDYRTVEWTALTRALWAALKAADSSIPPYGEWAKDAGDIDLWALAGDFTQELNLRLFRPAAAEAKGKK